MDEVRTEMCVCVGGGGREERKPRGGGGVWLVRLLRVNDFRHFLRVHHCGVSKAGPFDMGKLGSLPDNWLGVVGAGCYRVGGEVAGGGRPTGAGNRISRCCSFNSCSYTNSGMARSRSRCNDCKACVLVWLQVTRWVVPWPRWQLLTSGSATRSYALTRYKALFVHMHLFFNQRFEK